VKILSRLDQTGKKKNGQAQQERVHRKKCSDGAIQKQDSQNIADTTADGADGCKFHGDQDFDRENANGKDEI